MQIIAKSCIGRQSSEHAQYFVHSHVYSDTGLPADDAVRMLCCLALLLKASKHQRHIDHFKQAHQSKSLSPRLLDQQAPSHEHRQQEHAASALHFHVPSESEDCHASADCLAETLALLDQSCPADSSTYTQSLA